MAGARLNPVVDGVSAPPVPAVQRWKRDYAGAFGPLLDLSQAVPGYPPHPDLLRWLGEAGSDPACAAYGPIEGDDGLRAAFAADSAALYGAPLGPANVHITAGCNQAFIAAMMALAQAGDTVALSNPFYFNHDTSLALLGLRTTLVATEASNGFVPTVSAVEEALRKGARVVALVSPNNPTGAVYPPETVRALSAACRAQGAWLVLDETYRDFLAPGAGAPHGVFAQAGWEEGFVSLFSFSKSFCVPGHRVGAITAGPAVIEAVAKVMDNLQICAPRPAQAALARALPALREWREANRETIAARGAAMREALGGVEGWEVSALGAYFAFVRHPFEASALGVAERLAREGGVVTIPGSFFGTGNEGYLRFAFANAEASALSGLGDRLAGVRL